MQRGSVYDDGREIADQAIWSACYAPFASMYFDQRGFVRACCQNWASSTGNVLRQSIREVWDSQTNDELRNSLASGTFADGCEFCEWQARSTGGANAYAKLFDQLVVERKRPTWPTQMEFSLSVACNLQCEMCNGDLSSAIRVHREHREPLPSVYGDAFFEELAEFLPHLEQVNILGGEPFLGPEALRLMELLVSTGATCEVTVATNGTQWSPRVQRIVESLPMGIVVSLDGVTKATFESIRVGADFDQVMTNIGHLEAAARAHGQYLSLAFCLMRSNWWEFPDLLLFADEREYFVGANIVEHPESSSLYQLDGAALDEVIAGLERRDAEMHDRLGDRLLPVWRSQLDTLRAHRHATRGADRGGHVFRSVTPAALFGRRAEPDPTAAGLVAARSKLEGLTGRSSIELVTDPSGRITTVTGPVEEHLPVDCEPLMGRSLADLVPELLGRLDFMFEVREDELMEARLYRSSPDPIEYRLVITPARDRVGRLTGGAALLGRVDPARVGSRATAD